MILLGVDSLLLLYITLSLGIFTLALIEKIFKHPVEANILGVLICGLIFSSFYFNLVSFIWPVNYFSLIPLFIAATVILIAYKQQRTILVASIRKQLKFIFSGTNLLFTIPILILLVYYWVIPPFLIDSADYHYSTILWYEKYKVIPGLANVHGRFAFNPVAFIIQAAYSFTGLTGQALYPLNGVLMCLFLLWLLVRITKNKNSFTGFIYFALFFMVIRALLPDISSPTPDTLFLVCLYYIFIKLYDSLEKNNVNITTLLLPVLMLLFAVTAKLAVLPALMIVPFVLYILRNQEKPFPLVLKLAAISLLMYLPWLCRNVILSGYLIYPLLYIDIFSFDWKAPKDILTLEVIYIHHLSKSFLSKDLVYLQTLPFSKWFFKWVYLQFHNEWLPDVMVFLMAVFSPLYWLVVYIKSKKIPLNVFIFWLIVYACIWFWVSNSPDYRFGVAFLAFAILIPWLLIAGRYITRTFNVIQIVLAIMIIVVVEHHCTHDANIERSSYSFTLKDFWLFPLKDKRYFTKNDKATFRYTVLKTGVRLYYEDSTHACINTDLPCMVWDYGQIEMRGNQIEDGFRNVRDDVPVNFPFVK